MSTVDVCEHCGGGGWLEAVECPECGGKGWLTSPAHPPEQPELTTAEPIETPQSTTRHGTCDEHDRN